MKKNEIVQIHNDFTNDKLKKLNSKELDLLMTICTQAKNKNDKMITIDFCNLKQMSNYTATSNNTLTTDLRKIQKNLIKNFIFTYEDTDGATVTTSLFKEFRTYKDRIDIEVSEPAKHILNNLKKNFTVFELKEFTELESKYSKRLYKLLKQYRTTGTYHTTKEQLYIDLDIPETYKACDFNKRALNPALKECEKYFKNLKCETEKKGRGGTVKSYTFTFTKEKNTQEPKKQNKNKFNNFEQKQDYDFAQLEEQIVSN